MHGVIQSTAEGPDCLGQLQPHLGVYSGKTNRSILEKVMCQGITYQYLQIDGTTNIQKMTKWSQIFLIDITFQSSVHS